ncbi:hypothetical protein LIER_01292 [Lithospermum erythrorhizon]|uniref:RING-type E3 ubiquitin transferase n=1 Tax=Lithospermum erythrorhizon TaxID=34254 RepID=A0AAV3NMR9_LITER
MSRERYPEVDLTPVRVVVAPPSPAVRDDVIHVAVGNVFKESELTLRWALHNSGGRIICIIHVHQPARKIPFMGPKFSTNQFSQHQVRLYHEAERQNMQKTMDKYMLLCQRSGVRAEKLVVERDSIEKGIVDLISENGIRKLVVGGAANRSYSKKLTEPRSSKAIYICQHAPDFCHIWFVCKGHLINIRESKTDFVHMEITSPATVATPTAGQFSPARTSSATEEQTDQPEHSVSENYRFSSVEYGVNIDVLGSQEGARGLTPRNRLITKGSDDAWSGTEWRIPSGGARLSTCSSSDMIVDSGSTSALKIEATENQIVSQTILCHDDHNSSSLPCSTEANDSDELYDRLQQFVADAKHSKREAYEESVKMRKAEKEAIDAICKAKASEAMYTEELRRKRQIEEEFSRHKEEVERIKKQLDEIIEDLRVAQEQKSSLESEIAYSDLMVQELEQKIIHAVDLLQKYKKERDDLEVERDNALRVAEELRERQAERPASERYRQFFAEFSYLEIKEATRNFDPTLRIGEGGFGSIYKGLLRHTQVAIKMLHPNTLQGPIEFQQEVNILSKLRHPNLVTLIGACPESWSLVYEYLPNGSLEDRLNCKDNTQPLSWQTRIRIAAELCSVLIFLHSSRPQGIIHGDLKPANILLDANYQSKLSDFGICRVITQDEFSGTNTLLSCRTDPRGTFAYMDPEFLDTGELTHKSDVYSFGVILLRLLTGKPALGITMEVQYALNQGRLKDLLDPTAGDWPFVQAKQLAHLAMNCCEMKGIGRPKLSCEVWRLLDPMRASCGVSSSRLGSEELCQIPSYFICPIFQELMQDPVVAADGFTYEAEALKGWLDTGHDTSPMTNLKLTHCNLIQNHALRSAIQEWLQQP